jgi:hypothetical protein
MGLTLGPARTVDEARRVRPRSAALAALGCALALAACASDPADPGDPDTAVAPLDTVDVMHDTTPDATEPIDTNLCAPDALYCVSIREAAVCNAVGDGPSSVTPCNGATACEPATGLCRPTICAPDKQLCLNLHDYQVCNANGSGWSETRTCASDRFCADGACRACQANRVECLSETTFRACPADSSAWSPETPCPDEQRCIAGACEPCDLATECLPGNKLHRYCQNPAVDFDETVTCQPGRTCMDGGCFACSPDVVECKQETTFRRCSADGLAWGGEESCGTDEVCFQRECHYYGCIPRVLLLVDSSGSMGTNWIAVKNTIAALVAANPNIRFGLKNFPSAGTTCDVDASIEIPFAQDQSADFVEWFQGHSANGATPLVRAMQVLNENAAAMYGAFGGAVVLLSDGDDTCYTGGAPKVDAAVATSGLYLDHKVRTYVIAYNYSGDTTILDTIANNGGSGAGYLAADDQAELLAAFQEAVDDVKLCDESP